MKTTIKSPYDTLWWTKKKQFIFALKYNFKKFLIYLFNSSATKNTDLVKDTIISAKDILTQINLKFLFFLQFWDSILGHIDKTNLFLQFQNQTIDVTTKLSPLFSPLPHVPYQHTFLVSLSTSHSTTSVSSFNVNF